MATHELYVGGPKASTNTSQAMYPRPAFVQADWANTQPAAHKGPTQYALTRRVDAVNDYAMAHFLRNNAVVAADVLNLQGIPAGSLLYAVEVNILQAEPGLSLTFSLSNGVVLGAAIDANVVGRVLLLPTSATNITASGAADLSKAYWVEDALMLRATVTAAATAGKLGKAIFEVSPLISIFDGGAY